MIIDADHSYESTLQDIEAWWPKVKSGGVMIGHDYETVQFPGVKRAVQTFFDPLGPGDKVEIVGWSEDHGGFWKVRKP